MSANLKQKSVHALLLAFILASILFLLPDAAVDHEFGFTSSELEVKETVEKNATTTSYVNSEGTVTDAIDMGYATVQRTRDSAGQVIESFTSMLLETQWNGMAITVASRMSITMVIL